MSGLADSFREMWKTALTALGQLNTLVPAYWDGALDTALRVVRTALPLFAAVLLVQLVLLVFARRKRRGASSFSPGRWSWCWDCAFGPVFPHGRRGHKRNAPRRRVGKRVHAGVAPGSDTPILKRGLCTARHGEEMIWNFWS